MSKQYKNLLLQLDKLRRHNRQGSFKTRERYCEAMKCFCRFLAERYRLEQLANIAPKHFFAYVYFLRESGKAASTIKTELSAIRFFHDLIPNPRFELPDNSQLLLQRRALGGVDRTWSIPEFNRYWLAPCLRSGRTTSPFSIWGAMPHSESMSASESTPRSRPRRLKKMPLPSKARVGW